MTEQGLTTLASILAFCFVTHCIHSYAVQKLYVTGKSFLLKKDEGSESFEPRKANTFTYNKERN